MLYDSHGDPLYLGMYYGTVVDNADPENLGRARINVPGMQEPASAWALPVGGGHSSGAGGLGTFDAPPIGAAVVLAFHGGDPDQPMYFGGWHGQGEQFSVKPASPSSADKVKIFESARFLIVLNGDGGSEELLVKDKVTGDLVSMKPDQLKVKASAKATVIAPLVELGGEGLSSAPLINGVVLASGIDVFTGKTYGILQNASSVVTAKKA